MKIASEHKSQNGRLPPSAVAKSIGDVSSDVLMLIELQLKLLKLDSAETLKRSYFALSLLGIGILVLIASLPLAMIVAGYALHELFELSLATSFGFSLIVGLISGMMFVMIGWRKLSRSTNVFARSKEEFFDNVAWLKSTLKGQKS